MSKFKSVLRRHDGPLFRPADFDDSGCSLTFGGSILQRKELPCSIKTRGFHGRFAFRCRS